MTVQDRTVGCIVDEVTQVVRVAADQVQPVPIAMAAASRRYVAGLAKLDDRLMIILDVDKLFGPDEIDLDPAATSPPATPTESGE